MLAPSFPVRRSRSGLWLIAGLVALLALLAVAARPGPATGPRPPATAPTLAGGDATCPDPAALAVTDVPLLERRTAELEADLRRSAAAHDRAAQPARVRRELARAERFLGEAHRWARCARQVQHLPAR